MSNSNQFNELSGNNPFAELYEQFQDSNQYKQLQRKFAPVPYFQKFKSLRLIALISSYIFNLFSGLTACTLLYFFIFSLSGLWYVAAFFTVCFIMLLEVSKRTTNGHFFRNYLQYRKVSFSLLLIGLLLIGLSVTFSFYGSKQIVTAYTPPAQTVTPDSLTAPLSASITSIDRQIKDARKTKWKGTTTTTSQRTIESLSKQKLSLQNRLLKIEEQTDNKNETITAAHQKITMSKSTSFALFTLLFELLFILCAFYLEYYDYRSFAEITLLNQTKEQTPITPNDKPHQQITNGGNLAHTRTDTKLQKQKNGNGATAAEPTEIQKTIVIDSTSKDAIEKAIKQVRNRITSAQYRIRNKIGRAETSKQNVERFTKELEELKGMLA